MTRHEDDRYRGRRPPADAPEEDRTSLENRVHDGPDPSAGRSHGRVSERYARGGAQSDHAAERQATRNGECDDRDHSRGQNRSGGYDPYRARDYRQGSGYGGYGEAPGEAAGGLDSGRHYSAEPGWGPGYGTPRYERSRRHEGEGRYPHGQGPRGPHPKPDRFDSRRGVEPQSRDNGRLRQDVCERLMWRGVHLDVSEVSIEVKDGVVVLEGAVPERRMIRAIEAVVDECMGVKEIQNRIRATYAEHLHFHAGRASEQGEVGSSGRAGSGKAAAGFGRSRSSGGRSREATDS